MNAIDRFFDRLAAAGGIAMRAEPALSAECLREQVDALVRDHPRAAIDPLWLEFLATRGGATIDLGPHAVILLGFDDRICPHLRSTEGPLIDAEGFLDFALVSLAWPDRAEGRYLDLGFAFATDEAQRPGVHLRDSGEGRRWFARSFADWLEQVGAAAHELSSLEGR